MLSIIKQFSKVKVNEAYDMAKDFVRVQFCFCRKLKAAV